MSVHTDLICQIEILSNAKGFVKYAKGNPFVGRVRFISEMADSTDRRGLKRLDFTVMGDQESVFLVNSNEALAEPSQKTNISEHNN